MFPSQSQSCVWCTMFRRSPGAQVGLCILYTPFVYRHGLLP